MGSPAEHLARFQYHSSFAQRLKGAFPEDLDWYLVVLFYSALHLVDGYLATKSWNPILENHGERRREMKNCPELNRRFQSAYRLLQDVSEQVRYDPAYTLTKDNVTDAEGSLERVKSFLEGKLRNAIT